MKWVSLITILWDKYLPFNLSSRTFLLLFDICNSSVTKRVQQHGCSASVVSHAEVLFSHITLTRLPYYFLTYVTSVTLSPLPLCYLGYRDFATSVTCYYPLTLFVTLLPLLLYCYLCSFVNSATSSIRVFCLLFLRFLSRTEFLETLLRRNLFWIEKLKVLIAFSQSLFVEVTIGALGKDFVPLTSQPPLGKRETFASHFEIRG